VKNIRFLYPGGKTKAVTFSYDDGVNCDEKMIGILNSCGLRGTFNLNSGQLRDTVCWPTKDGKEMIRVVNREDVARIYEGHEVAIHGLTHPFWSAMPKERALYEMLQDKTNLEQIVGYPVRGLAYPFFFVQRGNPGHRKGARHPLRAHGELRKIFSASRRSPSLQRDLHAYGPGADGQSGKIRPGRL
jgi:hypothetical protein